MGLKYEILLLPIEAEAFYKAMLNDFGIDETKYLQEDNEEWNEHSAYFNKLFKKEEGYTWEGLEALAKKRDTLEMKEYKKRTEQNIQIYFVKCPVRDDWTVCIPDNVPFFDKLHNIIYGYYLHKFLRVVDFVIYMSFTSVTGGGSVGKHYKGKDGRTKTKQYKQTRLEEFQFEVFLKRLRNISPYPIADYHFWMKKDQAVRWEWEYHVRFKVKEDVQHIKQELGVKK